MSVAIVMTLHDNASAPYLPVATDAVFAAHWLPAAATMGLVWMPLFQSGTSVPIADFEAICAEFDQMRVYFAAAPGSAPLIAHLRERSRWLCAALAQVDPAALCDLFIG